MHYNPSEPRLYSRRGRPQPGRWEIDLRGVLDNGFIVKRERRVFPATPAAGKIGKRQAVAMAWEEWQRWNRHGQVLRPGETPALSRTGGMTPTATPTFAQFAPDFLDFCASINAGPRGANTHAALIIKETVLRVHLLPAFGHMPMDRLHRRDVDAYVARKTKEGRAPGSIRIDLNTLRRMLGVAEAYDLVPKVPSFRVPSDIARDVVALDPDEARRFSEAILELFEPRRAVLLELYLRTGLRAGEALGLHPADFNLDAGHVRVCRSWSKRGYGPTKGKTSRLVPLVPDLAARIDDLLCERGMSPTSTTEHPFSTERDPKRPLSIGRVEVLVRRAGERAETRRLHPHMLRHTFGTDCARRGVPVPTIQAWMGHARVTTTMRYVHLAAADHLRHAALLSD